MLHGNYEVVKRLREKVVTRYKCQVGTGVTYSHQNS
jgi:hypothetical protein